MKCDYCLKMVESVSPPVRLRENSEGPTRWTTKQYFICSNCKRYLRGVFKYVKLIMQNNKPKPVVHSAADSYLGSEPGLSSKRGRMPPSAASVAVKLRAAEKEIARLKELVTDLDAQIGKLS